MIHYFLFTLHQMRDFHMIYPHFASGMMHGTRWYEFW